MDALRKAEEQKRSEAVGAQEAPAGLVLEPLTPPASSDSLPELPSRLEDLDDQFDLHAAKPRPQPAAQPSAASIPLPRPDATDSLRASARNLFEAKQAAPENNRSFAITAGIAGLIGAIGIGAYFWWQLQPKGGLGAPPAAALPAAALPAPAQIAAAPPSPHAPAPAIAAVPPAPTFNEPASSASPPAPPVHTWATDEENTAPPRRTAPKTAPSAAAGLKSPIRLSSSTQKIDPLLDQAWQAFNSGEVELARAAWQKVLAADPRNSNALHGLAALAQQRRQPDEAAEYYLRVLEADPKDALALAALTSLRIPTDAQQTESRLKTLLAEQPDSPWLNFALGNLYARGARWADAQQAYFRAHAADPANPDYLFNLAVSLDQLRQPRLALQYYGKALVAAAKQPAGFDAAQVATRLKTLQASE